MEHFVYELIDPRTNAVRYVGITANPDLRLQQHALLCYARGRKKAWLEEMSSASVKPAMRIIEQVGTRKEARRRERYWIREYINRDCDLVNVAHNNTNAHENSFPSSSPMLEIEEDQQYKLRGYYTAGEAIQKLNNEKNRFYRWVQAGLIRKIKPFSRKQALYAACDVDALALVLSQECSPAHPRVKIYAGGLFLTVEL